MTAEELLIALQDIEAPAAPAWWQIAPGWWWLAGAILLLVLGMGLWQRQRRVNRIPSLASEALRRIDADFAQDLNHDTFALRLSHWLKQVALLAYPERRVAGLSGRRWVEFLAQSSGDSRFIDGVGEVFAGPVYRAGIQVDAEQLIALCGHWLRQVKPRLQRRGLDRW